MKNNYRKLKFSILLQTVLVTALTVLVGGFILDYVIDGIYNDSFAEMFVEFVMSLGMKEKSAIRLYWQLIGNNKMFFIIVGFLLLFAMFYYVALSKMMKYVDQIGDGIENILSESTKPIHLITELKPIEIRLNEIKATLKRQEIEAEEGEKKKNDLVLFFSFYLIQPSGKFQHIVGAAALAVALRPDFIQGAVCPEMLHVTGPAGKKRMFFHHKRPEAFRILQVVGFLYILYLLQRHITVQRPDKLRDCRIGMAAFQRILISR